MIRLRARGIYALPDGDEFVIQAVFRGGYLLYRREPWEFFGAYAYEIQFSRADSLKRARQPLAYRRFDGYQSDGSNSFPEWCCAKAVYQSTHEMVSEIVNR